ncbi:hypothetical protein [Paenibacillus sp. RC67]|uniref:hypothetical protein n=1 Tax=Paenibacillus sp. RC67 TaxID=3039392 RepID=UPI0024AE49F7|nr:hypothetical protein [Paenibacillus sp. RC67]
MLKGNASSFGVFGCGAGDGVESDLAVLGGCEGVIEFLAEGASVTAGDGVMDGAGVGVAVSSNDDSGTGVEVTEVGVG